MSEHSELPWVAEPKEPMAATICRVGPVEICTNGDLGDDYADARHIVHCVNNHERLVEALRGFVSWSDEQEWRRPGKRLGVKFEQARALLAELDAGEGGEV